MADKDPTIITLHGTWGQYKDAEKHFEHLRVTHGFECEVEGAEAKDAVSGESAS